MCFNKQPIYYGVIIDNYKEEIMDLMNDCYDWTNFVDENFYIKFTNDLKTSFEWLELYEDAIGDKQLNKTDAYVLRKENDDYIETIKFADLIDYCQKTIEFGLKQNAIIELKKLAKKAGKTVEAETISESNNYVLCKTDLGYIVKKKFEEGVKLFKTEEEAREYYDSIIREEEDYSDYREVKTTLILSNDKFTIVQEDNTNKYWVLNANDFDEYEGFKTLKEAMEYYRKVSQK